MRLARLEERRVVDGAAMTSSACQNPSLTYMAFAARASHYAVWAARRGEI